jgi:hypothetical protein
VRAHDRTDYGNISHLGKPLRDGNRDVSIGKIVGSSSCR